MPGFLLLHWAITTVSAPCRMFLRWTLVRFFFASILFPVYVSFVFIRFVLPGIVTNILNLATRHGRGQILAQGKSYRHERDALARRQLNGVFIFEPGDVGQAKSLCTDHGTASELTSRRKEFVEILPGVKAAVWRSGQQGGPPVVLLHGSFTSSCMYRDVSYEACADFGCGFLLIPGS